MPRPLRIQFPGAIYHLMNRGGRREPIFRDDSGRHRSWRSWEKCVTRPNCRIVSLVKVTALPNTLNHDLESRKRGLLYACFVRLRKPVVVDGFHHLDQASEVARLGQVTICTQQFRATDISIEH